MDSFELDMKSVLGVEESVINALTSATSVMNDALIIKSHDGTILSWNPAATYIFGYEASEIVGRNSSILSLPSFSEKEQEIEDSACRNEKISRQNIWRRHKNGTAINILLSIVPLLNEQEKKKITAEIISKVKPVFSETETATKRLAAIVDSSDDAIISKTLRGVITSWNFGAEKIFGYTEQEALGKHITMLIPPELQQEEDVIINKIRSGERVDHFETIRVTKNGKRLNISLTVSPIKNDKGEVVGASKIARDITEKVEIENRLKQYTTKLKELNSAKDEFIGMASHELKTPLTSINAYLQLLDKTVQNKQAKVFLAKTMRQVGKLSRLISDLLDISKIEAGKLQLSPTAFNADSLIDEAVENVQQITATHKIIRENRLGDIEIMADRARIEQVLINFLTNSIKYSPGKDKVLVSTFFKNEQFTVAVKDFGIGVPASEAKKIFDRFYRVQELNPTLAGLGIGLYISQEIIERHHGKVWLESQPGKGSTFYFRIPAGLGNQ